MYKNVEEILEAIKSGSINVSKLAENTKIPAGRMYKWKDRGSKISAEDYKILEKSLSKLDNSPETNAEPALMPVLVELMKKQNIVLENQNRLLEAQNGIISDKFEKIETNLNGVQKTQQEFGAMLGEGLGLLFEFQAGERSERTAKDLKKVWSSRVLRKMKKTEGIPNDVDR